MYCGETIAAGCMKFGPTGAQPATAAAAASAARGASARIDEDKVAQRAVTMALEAVYEQDFLPCSYGFRPGRSAHQALRTLQNVLWAKRLYWVIDIDIRKYFDSIPHSHLRTFLDQRVHGRRHPTDDRQMAEGGGRRRRSPAPHDRGFPARGRDLALPSERLPFFDCVTR